MSKNTFGVIVANRGFFPDKLAENGREDILNVLHERGYDTIQVEENETNCGAIETLEDAKKCARLFRKNSNKIDGIIVTHPNFGEEKGILQAIRRSELEVPILIQAEPDNSDYMDINYRRDSFCGKISDCNNLRQAGIPYTLTEKHTVSVKSPEFFKELENFASVCNIVKGVKERPRFGAIGARPAPFNTVRYSEKILEREGIVVEPLDLSEIFGKINRLDVNAKAVKDKFNSLEKYINTERVDKEKLLRMARFGFVVDEWIDEMDLDGITIQCWTSLEENYGIVPCTIMSMLGESLIPAACEVDVTGLLGMYILQLASGKPSAILDWNNNFNESNNKCVLFHCSNLPKSFFNSADMKYQQIIAGSVGKDNTYGTIEGKIAAKDITYCRASTDDNAGELRFYTGGGKFTDDELETFGGYGVAEIPNLQSLMQYICKNGFEHHVAVNISRKAKAIKEALGNYLDWEIYRHT